MKTIRSAGALALALLVAACGAKQNSASDNQGMNGAPAAQPSNEIYTGTGTVQSITGDQVTIAHGPIPDIGWPAMTMAYTAPPDLAGSVKVGAKVDFSFKKNGSAYVLTSVKQR